MKTSEAQLRASKKYLADKKRVNVVFTKEEIERVEHVIDFMSNAFELTLPEFIRFAVEDYCMLLEQRWNIPKK